MSEPAPQLGPTADPEEDARAQLYGLLSRLWLAPPARDFLQALQAASVEIAEPGGHLEEPGGHLEKPWHALIEAARATRVETVAEEYEALFEGVGKPEVFVCGSYYLAGFLNERPLVRLRDDLRELGLARDVGGTETEDHVAFLFEVMRYLIAGADAASCNLEQQRRFFRAHLQPWVDQLCEVVEAHPHAVFWRAVAGLTRAFLQVETQAFDMLEA